MYVLGFFFLCLYSGFIIHVIDAATPLDSFLINIYIYIFYILYIHTHKMYLGGDCEVLMGWALYFNTCTSLAGHYWQYKGDPHPLGGPFVWVLEFRGQVFLQFPVQTPLGCPHSTASCVKPWADSECSREGHLSWWVGSFSTSYYIIVWFYNTPLCILYTYTPCILLLRKWSEFPRNTSSYRMLFIYHHCVMSVYTIYEIVTTYVLLIHHFSTISSPLHAHINFVHSLYALWFFFVSIVFYFL